MSNWKGRIFREEQWICVYTGGGGTPTAHTVQFFTVSHNKIFVTPPLYHFCTGGGLSTSKYSLREKNSLFIENLTFGCIKNEKWKEMFWMDVQNFLQYILRHELFVSIFFQNAYYSRYVFREEPKNFSSFRFFG